MLKSKRFLLSLVLLFMFASVLAACGGNAGNGANDGETVTFKASNGNIEVPRNPQRIVDETAFYTGYFLALGVTPIGVQEEVLTSPYLKDKLAGSQSLGNAPTMNQDQILIINLSGRGSY